MIPKIKKVHWSASQNCNLKCEFCYLWRKTKAEPISTAVAKELIRQCSKSGVEWFVFGGGDPLLREDLPVLLAYSKEVGLKNDLQTNALLLNDQMSESILSYVDRLGLSLDGENEKIHDSIRNSKGHFNSVLNALQRCEKTQMPVVMRTTVLDMNLGKLARIGELLAGYSCVSKWSLREFIPLGLGKKNKTKFFVSRDVFLDECKKIRKYNVGFIHFPIIPLTSDEMDNCYCLITVDGHFYTHPKNGTYSSCGKFPFKSVRNIVGNMQYDSLLRNNRDMRVAYS